MAKAKNSEKIVIEVGPPGRPYAKIIRTERRLGIEDRRKLKTYIAIDRRKGLPDRRIGITE
jgi:hypothetical protein